MKVRLPYFQVYFLSTKKCFLDGELEARWLVAAGFPDLTKPFEQVSFTKQKKEEKTNKNVHPKGI